MRDIEIVMANPAGNITAFVLTPVDQKDYKKIGKLLLDNKELHAEQVGFVKEFSPQPRLEMCGLEFCGNAGRAFGLLCARESNIFGQAYLQISESGCEHPLLCDVDVSRQTAFISMPLPKTVSILQDTGISELDGATLVDLDGIVHVIMKDTSIEPSLEIFTRIQEYVMREYNPPAMGLMFVQPDKAIVPFVYVKEVDSIFAEGSCASGTTACAIAWSQNSPRDDLAYLVKEPAGELQVYVKLDKGVLKQISIGGPVELSEPFMINLNI
ncbi:MAG: hypothetical protein Q4D21_02545 [Phascolarctobacterium sp.]|nr:hypothetical protein [Phascolarctobacterium sp.]